MEKWRIELFPLILLLFRYATLSRIHMKDFLEHNSIFSLQNFVYFSFLFSAFITTEEAHDTLSKSTEKNVWFNEQQKMIIISTINLSSTCGRCSCCQQSCKWSILFHLKYNNMNQRLLKHFPLLQFLNNFNIYWINKEFPLYEKLTRGIILLVPMNKHLSNVHVLNHFVYFAECLQSISSSSSSKHERQSWTQHFVYNIFSCLWKTGTKNEMK